MGRYPVTFPKKTKTKQLSALRGTVSFHTPTVPRERSGTSTSSLLSLSVLPVLMEYSVLDSHVIFLLSTDVRRPSSSSRIILFCFGRVTCSGLCPSVYWVVCLLGLICSSFENVDTVSLSKVCVANICSRSVTYFFIFLVSWDDQKFLIDFLFTVCTLWVLSRKSWPIPSLQSCLPSWTLRSLIVSTFMCIPNLDKSRVWIFYV